jgi:hypothetical protein
MSKSQTLGIVKLKLTPSPVDSTGLRKPQMPIFSGADATRYD